MALNFTQLRPLSKVVVVTLLVGAIAAAWLFLTSAIFVVGTGLWKSQHKLPFLEAYLYWQYYPDDLRVLKWTKIGAAGASVVLGLVLVALVLRRPRQPLHGATGFADRGALKEKFRATEESILCGKLGDYLRFGTNQHVALYAPTDSGKGVSVVMPNALLWQGSFVAFDPKKEIFRLTAGVRAYCRQEVHLLDPLDQEGRTARYNPFSYVKRGTDAAFDDIQRIGQVLFPSSSGVDDFWQSAGRAAFNGVAAFLAETPELPFTLGEVFRTLTRGDGPEYLKKRMIARQGIKRPYSPSILNALNDYLNGSDATVNGIRKTVTARLELWNNPLVDAATAESDFDLRDLRKRLIAIYVGVSPDNTERLQPLLTLFFQQLLDVVAQQGEPRFNPLLRRKLLLLLDEFPLLGRMDKVADAFAWVRSYGVRILMITQTKGQLRDAYGPERARTIFENCGAEIMFGTDDPELTREISERLGYNTVSSVSRSQSGSLFSRKGNDSTTTSDQRRALMLPQEIRALSRQKCIILSPGMQPILADRILYYKDRTFIRLLMAPPEVKPIADAEASKPVAPMAPPSAPQLVAPVPEPLDRCRPAPVSPAPGEATEEAVDVAGAIKTEPQSRGGTRTRKRGGSRQQAAEPRPVALVSPEPSNGAAKVDPPAESTLKSPDEIWAAIFAARPDFAHYGLEDGQDWTSSIVGRLPGEPERTLAAGE